MLYFILLHVFCFIVLFAIYFCSGILWFTHVLMVGRSLIITLVPNITNPSLLKGLHHLWQTVRTETGRGSPVDRRPSIAAAPPIQKINSVSKIASSKIKHIQMPCLVRQTLCIVFDKNTKTGFLKVSNRYLFPQTPFSFIDRIKKPV